MEFNEFEELFKEKENEININISVENVEKFYKYMKSLIEWNEKINLTAIIDEEEIIEKHFIDSLTILKYIKDDYTMIDVGTGAGFPGIVLKIVFPHLKITLIDSLQKRVNYLNSIIKDLSLNEIEAIHSRGEDYHEKFDVVTARAVANIEKLLTYTMHIVNNKGVLVAMKANITEELNPDVQQKINRKYTIKKIEQFSLPYENSIRSLVVISNKTK